MKIFVLFASFFFIAGIAHSEEKPKKRYEITSNVVDPSVPNDQTKITVIMLNDWNDAGTLLRHDLNGIDTTVRLDSDNSYTTLVPAKRQRFQFFATFRHKEIRTRKLNMEGGHHITLEINFAKKKPNELPDPPPVLRKPVIYVYPKDTMDMRIELDVLGELVFSYPTYEDAWNFTAHPDGTIHTGEDTLNYLFWEAELPTNQVPGIGTKGSIVKGENVVSFLTDALTQFGLNSKERADFITYWAPSMTKSSNLYICFTFNDECNAFANLRIEPEPDELARIYLLWCAVDESFDPESITKQEIPRINRSGTTVIEWGGIQLEVPSSLPSRIESL